MDIASHRHIEEDVKIRAPHCHFLKWAMKELHLRLHHVTVMSFC